MGVLSDKELADLLTVKTTVEEAHTIKRRNVMLLAGLIEIERHLLQGKHMEQFATPLTSVGCPHCKQLMQVGCQGCSYVKSEAFGDDSSSLACLGAPFGGVPARKCACSAVQVQYGSGGERVMYNQRPMEYAAECIPQFQKKLQEAWNSLNDCRTLVLGHIEWANEVIERGGC